MPILIDVLEIGRSPALVFNAAVALRLRVAPLIDISTSCKSMVPAGSRLRVFHTQRYVNVAANVLGVCHTAAFFGMLTFTLTECNVWNLLNPKP